MSRVGLVLGGGGLTGAAFHVGALTTLEMATGWSPQRAEVVVGTSSGSAVAALLRSGVLSLDALLGDVHDAEDLADALRERIYRRTRPRGLARWMRHGLIPGIRRPGIGLAVGSPAPFTTDGIVEWLDETIGAAARGWPDRPTTIVAYEVEGRRRVAFGTEGSPDVGLATAVAASSAVPMLFEPVEIQGKRYVDGGVASGTNVDLLLGLPRPLDLVIVIAPMASVDVRPEARFYEDVVDRLGGTALTIELEALAAAWPETDVVVLRPDRIVLAASRANPLDASAALPAFLATLRSMRTILGSGDVWPVLERHFPQTRRSSWARRLRAGA